MNFITEVLHKFLYKGVVCCLDDMLIYSDTYEEHVYLVCEILTTLYQNHLYKKLLKCEFHWKELDFLGYWASGLGLGMDPAKVRDVLNWEPPRICRQL